MAVNINRTHSRLMYLFGTFKPSERVTLLDAARGDMPAFIDALDDFLEIWADASWLEEYNVERVGEWIIAKCPADVRDRARELAQTKLRDSRAADEDSVFTRTYRAFLKGMTPSPILGNVLSLHV